MASNYPTGPSLTTTPLITGPANPSLLIFYGFWVFTATTLGAFALHRAARKSVFQRAKAQTPATPLGYVGGFGALKPKSPAKEEESFAVTSGNSTQKSIKSDENGCHTPTSTG
jgi:hypothetical protein